MRDSEKASIGLPECPYCGENIGVIDADLTGLEEDEILKQDLRSHLFRHLKELNERVDKLEEKLEEV